MTYPPDGYQFFDLSAQGVADVVAMNSSDDSQNYIELIFSGQNLLRRVRAVPSGSSSPPSYTLTTLSVLPSAIPPSWSAQGYNHIGDIDFIRADGLVLAPVEEPTYTKPALLVYNSSSSTAPFTFVKGVVTKQRHCPWVAFDAVHHLVYSSEYDNVTSIYVYSWPDLLPFDPAPTQSLEKVGELGLQQVQGGVVRGTILTITTDADVNSKGNDWFSFDLAQEGKLVASGNVVFEGENNTVAETEGLTIDGLGRMWVVTNTATPSPGGQYTGPIYTLQ